MKTFDEAFANTYGEVLGVRQEKMTPEIERLLEVQTRYGGLIEDARINPQLARTGEAIVLLVLTGELPLRTALFSFFIAGLITGVEMEKNEI